MLGISVERRPWSANMPVLPQKSLLGKEHGAVSGIYSELTGNLSVFGQNTKLSAPFYACNALDSLKIYAISLLSNYQGT